MAGAPATEPNGIGDNVSADAFTASGAKERAVCDSNDWDDSAQHSMRKRPAG